MYRHILNSNSSPTLQLSVKFESQICHENINKPLDGAYLADFDMDIRRPLILTVSIGNDQVNSSIFMHFVTRRRTIYTYVLTPQGVAHPSAHTDLP